MSELQAILKKCTPDDLSFLVNTIDSFVNLSNDRKLKRLLQERKQPELNQEIEAEIRYLGSADIAYIVRKVFGKDPGVSVDEIVTDIARKFKCPLKPISTLEAKIERVIKFVVDKEFEKLSQQEIRTLFEKSGIGQDDINTIFDRIQGNKLLLLPVIFSILGSEIAFTILQGVAIGIIATILGRQAAQILLQQVLAKNPWISVWLGPIAWTASLTWLASDLQGPAYRKTIPIILYLGIVALRDGPEEGETFWNS